jgi:hypothetical protein
LQKRGGFAGRVTAEQQVQGQSDPGLTAGWLDDSEIVGNDTGKF